MKVLGVDNKTMSVNGKLVKAPSIVGTGDMEKSVYDPTNSVATAGGIPDYVANNAPVTSVNGKTGAVKIVKGDVGLGKVRNEAQYSAKNPPPYPVTSVNGATGDVTVREVPPVTASDDGKSAVVVNGVWAAVDKTPFYVNCTISGYGVYDENVIHDKTYAEIFAAHQAGRPCYAVLNFANNDKSYLPLTELMEGDEAMATFSLAQMVMGDTPEELQVFYVSISSNYAEGFQGSRYTAGTNAQSLPTVSASDNGKFLQVVKGAWTAVTIPDAEGGSY